MEKGGLLKRCKEEFGPIDESNCGDSKRLKTDMEGYCKVSGLQSRQLLHLSTDFCESTLSPISEIAINLSDTSIGTPQHQFKNQKNVDTGVTTLKTTVTAALSDTPVGEKRIWKKTRKLLLEDDDTKNIAEADVDNSSFGNGLISNSFTLNTGGRNAGTQRGASHGRGAQRRLNIAPLALDFEEDADLHEISPDEGNRMAVDEISFYSSQSPAASPRVCPSSPPVNIGLLSPEGSPKRFTVVQNTVTIVDKRRSVDEFDGCSVDSGYGMSSFKFTEPQLPKRLEPSPCKPQSLLLLQGTHCHREAKTSPKNFRIFHSLSSGSTESMEDDYMELYDMDQFEDEIRLPSNLNSLISGHIVKTPEMKRPSVRRCLSLTENNSMQQARSALFEPKTPEILKPVQDNTTPFTSKHLERCFKRPEPPSLSPVQSKRYKIDEKENKEIEIVEKVEVARPILRKSISLNETHIMSALARSSSEPDLIGDFSKPFCLPLMEGRHMDLKSISPETMARLIRGDFNGTVASFKIIDCRYPYEYEGGHIRGAQNLYTHEQILEELMNIKTEVAPEAVQDGPKRHILVFHCEFSSERGPKLSRFLRNRDRLRNSHKYPALNYPEIYLLHGGYKEFFENYADLCDPVAYRPMLDPKFGVAYKQFRAKSKSWNGDIKASGSTNRLVKSRSRLVL